MVNKYRALYIIELFALIIAGWLIINYNLNAGAIYIGLIAIGFIIYNYSKNI